MIQLFKDLIFYILIPVWQLLDFIIPKDRSNLIFLLQTDTFRGDIRTFYLFCREKSDYNAYLLVKPYRLYQQLKRLFPGFVLYLYRPSDLWVFIRTKYFFATHYRHLKPLYVPYGTKTVIGLQHGVTALKKGYYLQNPSPFYTRPYEYVIASSEFQKSILEQNMRIRPGRIWVTGFPRLDDLNKPYEPFLEGFPEIRSKKIILYAPTSREMKPTELFPFSDFNPDELRKKMIELEAVLLIKFHPNSAKQMLEENFRYLEEPNLIEIAHRDQIQDLNRILQYTDLLITDYSSIFFDHLFFNKPVIFLPGDLESFQKERGFIIDFTENTPGLKIHGFTPLLEAIETCLKHPESHADDRLKLRKKIFSYGTFGNCDRVWDHFIRLRDEA